PVDVLIGAGEVELLPLGLGRVPLEGVAGGDRAEFGGEDLVVRLVGQAVHGRAEVPAVRGGEFAEGGLRGLGRLVGGGEGRGRGAEAERQQTGSGGGRQAASPLRAGWRDHVSSLGARGPVGGAGRFAKAVPSPCRGGDRGRGANLAETF